MALPGARFLMPGEWDPRDLFPVPPPPWLRESPLVYRHTETVHTETVRFHDREPAPIPMLLLRRRQESHRFPRCARPRRGAR